MRDQHPSSYSYVIVGFYAGTADVIYYDASYDKCDEVHMKYVDSQNIEVSYLNQQGEIVNY